MTQRMKLLTVLGHLFILSPAWTANERPLIVATLCEIANDPDRFNGKMIKVRATVLSNFEVSLLSDSGCGLDSSVWFTYGDARHTPSAATESAPITSLADLKRPESLTWSPMEPSAVITVKEDSEFRKLDSYLSKQFKPKGRNLCISCPLSSVTAVFTGRFDHTNRRLRAYRDKDSKVIGAGGSGFGHLGGYDSQFVMHSVSEVVAVKIDPAVYKPKK